jgi:hypothetical protein
LVAAGEFRRAVEARKMRGRGRERERRQRRWEGKKYVRWAHMVVVCVE